MLKKILIGLAVVLALLVGAVLLLPSLVDWNAYKDQIAEQVERATGRELTIAGDMSLAVLPTPRLTAEGVTLANLPGGQAEHMVTLDALEVTVALAPLLSGRVQVQSVVLVAPTVVLERLPDGRGNWQLGPPAAAAPTAGAPEAGSGQPQPPADVAEPAQTAPAQPDAGQTETQPTDGGLAVSLDSLIVEDGTIVYRELASGAEYRVQQVGAEIAADSLRGPFQAEGEAVYQGTRATFEARSGRLDGGATPLGLELRLPEVADSTVTFSGSFDAATTALEGELQGRGGDLATLIASLQPQAADLPSPLAAPFSLDTSIAYGGERLELAALQLSLGEIGASGDVSLGLAPQIEGQVALTVARLDLDALLAATASGGGGQSSAPSGAAAGFSLPGDIALGFELVVEALVYNGEVVRQVLAGGRLAEGQVRLDQAIALLPGGGDVSLSGTLAAVAGAPNFNGQVEAASDNLRGLAQWLEIALPEGIPADRLRSASYASAVAYAPDQLQLGGIVLQVDSTTAQGGVTLALGRAKPAFGAGLTLDRLNLDAYLPGSGGGGSSTPLQLAQAEETPEGAPAAAGAGDNPLEAFDANLNLRLGTLTYRGQQANQISLQGRVQDGVLTVQNLEVGDLVGGSAQLSGVVSGLPDAVQVADGRYALEVPDTARLARLLGQPAAGPLAQLGSLSASGSASGGLDALTTDSSARIPEGTLAFAGEVRNAASAPVVRNGRIAAELSDTGRLAGIAGLADSPLARLGSVSLNGGLSGSADDLSLDLDGRMLGGTLGTTGRILQRDDGLHLDTLRLTAQGVEGARIAQVVGPQAEALAGLGPLGLDTTMNGSLAGELRYETVLRLLEGRVRGQGTANGLTGEQMSFAFDSEVELPELRRLLGALGGAPTVRPGIGLQSRARISGTPLNVAIENLEGALGPTTLAGTTRLDLTGARPSVQANLQLGEVPLDRILDDSLGGGGGQSSGRWSREPLGIAALNDVNATLDLTARSVSRGELAITDLGLPLRLDNGVLQIDPLTGGTLGGDLRLRLSVDARDPEAAAVAFDLVGDQLQTRGLIPEDSAAAGRVSGPLSLQVAGNSRGQSEAALVENLDGQGSVQGDLTVQARTEEAVGNVLLGILGQQISELRGVTETINTVFNAFAGAPSRLDGRFDIQQGVVRTGDMSLTGRNAVARAEGVLAHLPAWATELKVDLFRGEEQQPYLTVNLTGSLDEPNVRVSGQPFQRRQEQQPAPSDGQAPPEPQEQAEPEQPRTPEEQLREEGEKLLRGLFERLQ